MVLVDLAIPRDIEAEVSGLDDAFLYTIDDLGKMVVSRIQLIEGITRTLTCPVVNL